MPQCPDLPPVDAGAGAQTITFDFGAFLAANYPAGTTLTGTPQVTCTVSATGGGSDDDPASRITGGPVIGTAPPPNGSGLADCAVLFQFADAQPKCVYLLVVSCAFTGTSDNPPLWARLPVRTPN